MMVMPANNRSAIVHYWGGRYPGKLGHMVGPGGWRSPYAWLPYALDNGAFPAWQKGYAWDAEAFDVLLTVCKRVKQRPLWVVVPDVVADAEATIKLWSLWAPQLRANYGFNLCFAAQDGMSPSDVPADADMILLGGTVEWKWANLHRFCDNDHLPPVHVGRVNTYRHLWLCHEAGAVSCDGTGWFRGDQKQIQGLERYLMECAGEIHKTQARLWEPENEPHA